MSEPDLPATDTPTTLAPSPSPTATTPNGHGSAQPSPDWWRTGVLYQIYPRSFADSSGDGVGDLAGIIDRLDYLNNGTPDSLGVDAIWLSPIYPSPGFDVGYDVSDYTGIDPLFGSMADFERLVEESHRRGIRVILDLVLNHTSHLHPWFVASRSGRAGPYSDFYIWRDPSGWVAGRPRRPNNWGSFFGGSAWTWDESRRQFYLHTFLPQQPDLNWRNPAARGALLDVVRTWLGRGVDGFRLDVFNVFFKDAELRSNPRRFGRRRAWARQIHRYDKDQPELVALLADVRAIVDEQPGRMTVGELFTGTVEQAAGYQAPGHLVFDFSMVETPWDAQAFAAAIAAREAAFGPEGWPTIVLSNHDQPRHASRFDDGRLGDARAKVAATLELTLRGTPFLYYGEEIGLRNVPIPPDEIIDPPARRASLFDRWWNRDQARAPMPWGPGPNGGFSRARPWLRMSPEFETRNVAAQDDDSSSLLSFYRRLVWLRRSSRPLQIGAYQEVDVEDRDVLAYVRRLDRQEALVVLSFADREAKVHLPAPDGTGSWRLLLSSHDASEPEDNGRLVLRPLEAAVFARS